MRAKLILVDDQRVYVELFRDVIAGQFDLAAVAGNYEDALAAVARCRPDAVVVDVNFEGGPGGRDGFQLAEALLALYPTLRVILVSAQYEPAYETVAQRLPRTTFVDKTSLTSAKLKDILAS